MKFKLKNYKGKYAMHCKTLEEANDFLKVLHENGRTWNNGESYLEINHWYEYEEYTCYEFNSRYYCSCEYYKDGNYTILEWSYFMKKEFTKDDLEMGMVVEFRNGDKCLVLKGNMETEHYGKQNIIFMDEKGLEIGSYYHCNLKHTNNNDYDVVKVWANNYGNNMIDGNFLSNLNNTDNIKLVYEREEVKQPTKHDIEIMKAMNLLYGIEWFAQDSNGRQYGYVDKPTKGTSIWKCQGTVKNLDFKNHLSHISWEDDKPYHFVKE